MPWRPQRSYKTFSMLHKKYRLCLEKDFERVFQKGRKIYSKFLGLRYKENQLECPRFAFLVSNKISKRAVDRNLLKRRLRVMAEKIVPKIQISYDVIVITMPGAQKLDFSGLTREFYDLLKKIRII